jgi:type II secretory pathway pseudopilin PulG
MKTTDIKTPVFRQRQSVALVVALLIMLVLTILGVTVMNMTSLEEKMAFNTQDRYHARYLAESAALIVATDTNLPSPDDAGVSRSAPFTLGGEGDGADLTIPGIKEGTVQIFYVQQTPSVNLPSNSDNMRYSSGSGADDPFVFQISASATTRAGTNARLKTGFYFDPPPSSNQN